MQERIELEKGDSSSAHFHALLYGYEFVTKLVASAFVAAIEDDADRNRYRLEHNLVRANGIGDWVNALNEAFSGPASTYLDSKARNHRADITQKVSEGDWRYQATDLLRKSLNHLSIEPEPQPKRTQLLQWFRDFTTLRNKTRGHGAPSQASIDEIGDHLGQSLNLVIDSLALFSSPWAYIRRNLTNKYRVCPLFPDDSPFAHLKSQRDLNYEDGVYISMDSLRLVRLMHTNQDLADFFVANGGFTDKHYDALSYVSGERQHVPSAHYLHPTDILPGSVTEGKGELDVIGECFTNLPDPQADYVERVVLQNALCEELLTTHHHPIVTLDGRGGIGKTSIVLHVVNTLAKNSECPYGVVLWFSARDIDLVPEGAKLVRPDGVTLDDFAKRYAALLGVCGHCDRSFNARGEFAKALGDASDKPTLFVFDNFETVVSPAEAYAWIDTYIRPPNKVVITTRIRGNFKADMPIHVDGMADTECEELIDITSKKIGIADKIDGAFINTLISESEGHPYVVKVLLGEVARSSSTKKVARVMASRDDILDALFDRTYDAISLTARRVFLTLSGWRSVVPELAVEAVVIRPGNEKLDVHHAIQELISSSLVDEVVVGDGEYFLSVPLPAQVFGQKKLEVSPHRGSIIEDIRLLQQFGAAQKHDVAAGLENRLMILFRNIASVLASGDKSINDFLPVVEYVARKKPKAWLYLADLFEDCMEDPDTYVRNCLMHYLERDGKDDSKAWLRVADLFSKASMLNEEISALVNLSKAKDVLTYAISNAVNRVNGLLRTAPTTLDHEDKRQLIRELADTLDKKRAECNATDLSRLAWLYLSLHEPARAGEIVASGLEKDPDNYHCRNLQERLERYR
jgi:hypothetical protein